MTVGTWYFVAFTTNNATADVYWAVAGATALSTANQNPFPAVAYAAPDTEFALWRDAAGNNVMTGALARVRLWEAVLTANELLAEFRSCSAVRRTNLIDEVSIVNDATKLVASIGTWTVSGTLGSADEAEPPAVAYQAGLLVA
jgi:hypothetical protein